MAGEVSAIAAPDATVLLDCFAPLRRGPLPRGASRAAIETAFAEWEVTNIEVADPEPDTLARLFKFDERFYRLRRIGTTGGGPVGCGTSPVCDVGGHR
jgi:hypothetical protein